ncbi:MAG: TrmH family RNA methyltransferase [Rubricoccaceae bacterium]|nr:TrmH family RNA methyltransferase [Rubricoccaceae bacterium]
MLPHPIAVVAHDLRSAHNVGSVFRTADSAGLRHVYLTGFTPTPAHRGVIKTALGAQDAVPWSHHADPLVLLRQLRDEGTTVAALERADGAVAPEDVTAGHFPLVLVLGNEISGVAPDLLAAADLVLALPQYGVKASLNVSVAFGVAAYGLVARYRALAG